VAATPPPRPQAKPDMQLDRLRKELAAETADATLTVATKGDFIVIGISNEVLFDPGAVRVKPAFDKVARDLVAALDKEAGPVTIVGYTDSHRPGAASVFKSNYDLSVARAKAIRDILIRAIGDPSRLHIEGKGDQDPVADNGTAEGRARNRRIEILIRRERTL
jgi:type VI secretion system protein ImpK